MTIIINPGTGIVANATVENAIENIKHFIIDCQTDGIECVRIEEEDHNDGRYAFLLWKGNCCHEIQMPGLPLERVRYTGSEGQNIREYPRLYVDGSSWVWQYAVLLEGKWK